VDEEKPGNAYSTTLSNLKLFSGLQCSKNKAQKYRKCSQPCQYSWTLTFYVIHCS